MKACELTKGCIRTASTTVRWVGPDPAHPVEGIGRQSRRACNRCAHAYSQRAPGTTPWLYPRRILRLASEVPGIGMGTLGHILGLSTSRVGEIVSVMREWGIVAPFGTMTIVDARIRGETPQEGRVLAALKHGPKTATQIAEHTGLTVSAARSMIKRLQGVGAVSPARGVVISDGA